MKLAKIAQYGIGIGFISVCAAYIAGGVISTITINNQNSFSGTVEIKGKNASYSGLKPNDPWIKFFGQDPNGNMSIKFANDDSLAITDNDLTHLGLSLEDKIKIILPGGQEIEFNYKGIYTKDGKYHPFAQGSEVETFFHKMFDEAREIENAVESAIKVSSLKR